MPDFGAHRSCQKALRVQAIISSRFHLYNAGFVAGAPDPDLDMISFAPVGPILIWTSRVRSIRMRRLRTCERDHSPRSARLPRRPATLQAISRIARTSRLARTAATNLETASKVFTGDEDDVELFEKMEQYLMAA